jgi:hypothetical protein
MRQLEKSTFPHCIRWQCIIQELCSFISDQISREFKHSKCLQEGTKQSQFEIDEKNSFVTLFDFNASLKYCAPLFVIRFVERLSVVSV